MLPLAPVANIATFATPDTAGIQPKIPKKEKATQIHASEPVFLAVPVPPVASIQADTPAADIPTDSAKSYPSSKPLQGLSYQATTNARSTLFSPTDCPVSFCPDTGTSICLIARKVLQQYFPIVPILQASERTFLSGIRKGPATDEFVYLPFSLVSTDQQSLSFTAEVHIIGDLAPGILLGTSFLAKYSIDII